MRIFIAGIMQGSRTDKGIDAQDYRHEITQILQKHISGVEVVDPLALDNSLQPSCQRFFKFKLRSGPPFLPVFNIDKILERSIYLSYQFIDISNILLG